MGLFPYVMQMLCFALAAYIGMRSFEYLHAREKCSHSFSGITRVTDNRHHATDVLSGAILGTVVAIIAVRHFRKRLTDDRSPFVFV